MIRIRINANWVAVVIVAFTTLLAVLSSLGDAPIVDEVPHIGAGYSYVETLDARLNPEHPPLVKDLAGLALTGLGLQQNDFSTAAWVTDVNGQWNFGRTLIFHSGVNPDTVKNAARLPELIFYFTICYFVWRWSRERSGIGAALLAVTLIAFSPTVIAHARLVTTDVASAAAVIAATYYFLAYLRDRSLRNKLTAGIVLGLALLCKFNTVLLGPFFILVALLWGLEGHVTSLKHWKRAAQLLYQTVLIGLISLAVVWGAYIIQTWNYSVEREVSDVNAIIRNPHNPTEQFTRWAADKPIIRSFGVWTLGLGMVEGRAAGGNTIYWMGEVVNTAGPLYFPIVYFLKEPIAWWFLIAMALASLVVRSRRAEESKHGWWRTNQDEWVMLLWLAIYWGISIHSTLNIGVRHLLPVYPFTIMLVSGRISSVMAWLQTHDRKRLQGYAAVLTVMLGWYVYESVSVFPFYLTYFNQIAGGPSGGYRYVVDSNVDWGQDLKRLGQWVSEHNVKRLSLDYFGWSDPVSYLGDRFVWTGSNLWKNKKEFLANNTSDGWVAVSVTFFQNANGIKIDPNAGKGDYRWLIDEKPVAIIGHSIFVWHIVK